jgi:glycosyltransferase involved in cell wall biosynthesis
MAACDVLIHPARYEPYGLAVHEAVSRGIPAIVSASAGVAERYPDSLGSLLLREPESASALHDALMRWRNDTSFHGNRILEFSHALRARTWDDMAREIVATIEDRAA